MKNTLTLAVLLSLSSTVVTADVIEVCGSCPIQSISEGIEVAKQCDTLLIKKGVYPEYDIQVDKSLVIIGEDQPLVDGENKGEIFKVTANHVTIDGLSIQNVGVSYTADYAAIRVTQCQWFTIQNVQLENFFFGIYLEKSSRGRIVNNRIIGEAKDEYNSGNGIHLWYSHFVDVSHNYVQGTRDGIYLEFSDNISIGNNISTKNLRYGLHFMFSDNDVYSQNTFKDNGAGVAVMFSRNIRMSDNLFLKNWGPSSYGMLLKEINDAEIVNNTFRENTVGISIEGSNRINFKDNDFIRNGWSLRVIGACYTNRFTGNNFISNSFDVSYNSKVNDNEFSSNYWDNYTGYDLDKDGIGDVPYRPVKLFSYIANKTPETIVLLRSLFMDIIDFSEKVSPVFTPDNLKDPYPLMKIRK